MAEKHLIVKNSPAANRVDLLTTVMHELTHALGYGHSDSVDLMYPTLLLGERRSLNEQSLASLLEQNASGTSSRDAIDQIFGSTAADSRNWILS